MMADNISLDQIRTDESFNLVSLYDENKNDMQAPDSPFQYEHKNSSYYEPDEFSKMTGDFGECVSYFHINCRGLSSNWESFRSLLCDIHGDKFAFDFIGVTEVYRCDFDARLTLPGYHDLITPVREDGSRGGVGLFIKNEINYGIRDDKCMYPSCF